MLTRWRPTETRRFNERLFEDLAATIRTIRQFFEYVVGHRGIGSGNAVRNPGERDVGFIRIAVLTGFDQPLRIG